MIRETINQLIEEITKDYPEQDIFEAKKCFQKISGEIFEDDKSYESRMGTFLEWFSFDRPGPDSSLTPIQQYLENTEPYHSPEKWELAHGVSKCIHSLFIAKKIKSDCILVVDLMDDVKYQVQENQGSMLFNTDDVFEGRLIPYKGQHYFTDHFCFHPKPVVGFIKSKIKNLKATEEKTRAAEKRLQKEIVSPQKKLNKVVAKISKLNGKLENNTKEKKIQSLKGDISVLDKQKEQLEAQVSDLANELNQLRTVTIEGENKQNRFSLIRKLSYMSLKWERSRQIDVRDIYQD